MKEICTRILAYVCILCFKGKGSKPYMYFRNGLYIVYQRSRVLLTFFSEKRQEIAVKRFI